MREKLRVITHCAARGACETTGSAVMRLTSA
jgi:hypothetical protein